MTKFQKQMLTIAAAGALTAVTALPAMALETQLNGSYQVRMMTSNWQAYENIVAPLGFNPATGAAAPLTVTSMGTASLRNGFSGQRYWYPAISPSSSTYFEQRGLLQFSAKTSDKLKLVTAFEIDSHWGDSSYNQDAFGQGASQQALRNSGGAIGADRINLETKSVYLDFICPITDANVKIGMQPYNDSYKGIFLGPVDMAGINVQKKFGAATATAAFYRLNDEIASATATTNANYGRYTRDIYMLEGKYAINKDINAGLTYYYHTDNTAAALAYGVSGTGIGQGGLIGGYNMALHTVGLNADAKFGALSFDAGFLAQAGRINDNPIVSLTTGSGEHVSTVGFAAQAGMKYTAGPGVFKTSFLWTSGDNQANYYSFRNGSTTISPRDTKRTAFINVQSATRESVYTGLTSFILLTSANRFGGSDRAVAPDMYNFANGVTAGALGYDAKFGKSYLNTNVVFLAASANNGNDPRHINKLTGERNNSRYMGTEINTELGYKLYDNLTVYTNAAYAFLGDYFKNGAGVAGTTFAGGQVSTSSLATNAKTPADLYNVTVGFSYNF